MQLQVWIDNWHNSNNKKRQPGKKTVDKMEEKERGFKHVSVYKKNPIVMHFLVAVNA